MVYEIQTWLRMTYNIGTLNRGVRQKCLLRPYHNFYNKNFHRNLSLIQTVTTWLFLIFIWHQRVAIVTEFGTNCSADHNDIASNFQNLYFGLIWPFTLFAFRAFFFPFLLFLMTIKGFWLEPWKTSWGINHHEIRFCHWYFWALFWLVHWNPKYFCNYDFSNLDKCRVLSFKCSWFLKRFPWKKSCILSFNFLVLSF